LLPWSVNASITGALQQVRDAFEFEKEDDMQKSKEIYDLMYSSGRYYPRHGRDNLISYAENVGDGLVEKFTKGLDVGCGHGLGVYEMVNRGFDMYGSDIADNTASWKHLDIGDRCLIAPANDMPYADNEFDFVYCGDVMEHVPEKYVDASLKEIVRVGSHKFWLVICSVMDTPSKGLMPSHLVLGGLDFWTKKITDAGLEVMVTSDHKHHVSILAKKRRTYA
jgi:ubiquinone/menaquinone biosynthesis C-methylase UbiE